ncbi:MAG: hypothetical protein AB1431_12635 [Pseudomonadota bacterium]
MATKPPIISPFIAKLLAPLPAADELNLEKEERRNRKEDWHEAILRVRRDMHLYEAAEFERLHNVFYGDGKQKSTSGAKFQAYKSVERLILIPVRSRDDIKIKRMFAKKVAGAERAWPESWAKAILRDDNYLADRKNSVS